LIEEWRRFDNIIDRAVNQGRDRLRKSARIYGLDWIGLFRLTGWLKMLDVKMTDQFAGHENGMEMTKEGEDDERNTE